MDELYCHFAVALLDHQCPFFAVCFNEKEKVHCCLSSKQYLQFSLNLLITLHLMLHVEITR